MAKRIRKRDLIIEFLQLITGFGKKAAPRFELGIKDLQSSALPLGHAAIGECVSSPSDRISEANGDLLVVSNGHGEDEIAIRVLQEIHRLYPELRLEVLPLVGVGKAFASAVDAGWLRCLGPASQLPSGGFSNQSLQGFIKDVLAGLMQISWSQWKCIRRASRLGEPVLAIGDLWPLSLAWMSGGKYGFIGTPKSDYTWRSGPGKACSDNYHRLKGTEWDPWEWALMKAPRCQLVAVRDQLTAKGLRRHGVEAYALGNPMMDGFETLEIPNCLALFRRLILLCGSRMPEAQENFRRLFQAIEKLDHSDWIAVLVALGSEPSIDSFKNLLAKEGYIERSSPFGDIVAESFWIKGSKLICFGTGRFASWARWAEVGLATAGTATEQIAGLGIPALSLPGPGPQFKRSFALRQSRLLGGAVLPCSSTDLLATRLKFLLGEEKLRRELGNLGASRMGPSGGSFALASLVTRRLLRLC